MARAPRCPLEAAAVERKLCDQPSRGNASTCGPSAVLRGACRLSSQQIPSRVLNLRHWLWQTLPQSTPWSKGCLRQPGNAPPCLAGPRAVAPQERQQNGHRLLALWGLRQDQRQAELLLASAGRAECCGGKQRGVTRRGRGIPVSCDSGLSGNDGTASKLPGLLVQVGR